MAIAEDVSLNAMLQNLFNATFGHARIRRTGQERFKIRWGALARQARFK
jgi:hypothetical protein